MVPWRDKLSPSISKYSDGGSLGRSSMLLINSDMAPAVSIKCKADESLRLRASVLLIINSIFFMVFCGISSAIVVQPVPSKLSNNVRMPDGYEQLLL